MQQYSQVRAMLAITKASLRAIFRSPSAVVFSFVFPFIFILVFGFIGNNAGAPFYKLVIDKSSDTANAFFEAIKKSERIRIVNFKDEEELRTNMVKGRIAGILFINKTNNENLPYTYTIKSTNASDDKWPQVRPILDAISNGVSEATYSNRPSYAREDFIYKRDIQTVREYKRIDFILPGQLGFSLLSSGVFGVAFMFFSLRSTLVLKRFFATPISRSYIVMGESLARVLFQMLTAIIIILVGYFCFGFTLVNTWVTFIEMLVLSFIGLLIFMGFGFIVSGLAKSESTIPPFANLITLPQFLLGGTFFSIEVFPVWLQYIAKILPLTYLNIAMRSVAFEGVHFWNVSTTLPFTNWQVPVIFILLFWGVLVYFIAIKVFKWES